MKKILAALLIMAIFTLGYIFIGRDFLGDIFSKNDNAGQANYNVQDPNTIEESREESAMATTSGQEIIEDKEMRFSSLPSASKENEKVPSTTTAVREDSTNAIVVKAGAPTSTLLLKVPFTSQAPFGDWKDRRQQDGCEEAAALMAVRWAQGKPLTRDQALKEIVAISDYEEKKYGSYHDTAVKDTIARIFVGYFKHPEAEARYDIGVSDIFGELAKGNLVIVPTNGIKLKNPFYTPPGPERHNIVIKGYDPKTDEFITNDPGTKRGESYRYKTKTVIDAVIDYPTGDHLPIKEERKAMIVVSNN